MEILTINAESQHYPNLRQTTHSTEMKSGKHTIIVVRVVADAGEKSRPDVYYIHNTGNAAARAWGSMGRRFDSVADAVAHYKTPAIRAMIEHAAGL